MQKIGFIGAHDKTDLIIYIAKIITNLGKKVLVVDSTLIQKARYVVPTINPSKTYITEYEDIDIAVGFFSIDAILKYLGIDENSMEYDYIFIDIDDARGVSSLKLEESKINYFVTSFDAYSIKRGLQVLAGFKTPATLTKVLYSESMLKEEDDYLNYLASNYNVIWNENRIYFPIENGDLTTIYENQRVAKIRIKKLSVQYKDSLAFIVETIMENTSETQIRRVMKNMEKGA